MSDKILLSVHKSITTKPKRLDGHSWSYDWTARNLFFDQFLNLAKRGKSFAVAQFAGNHRKAANFLQSNIIGIDVDSLIAGQPILDSHMKMYLSDSFVQDNAMLIAETSSSKPDARRFRVWFWLDEVIQDAKEYKELTTVIQSLVPYCDSSAKDAARGFFGTKGEPLLAQSVRVNVGDLRRRITSRTEKAPRRGADHRRKDTRTQFTDSPQDQIEQVKQALDCIPAQSIEYQTWVSILFSLKSLGDSDAIALAEQWSDFCSKPDEIKFKIETATQSMGLGYVFSVAKSYGYQPTRRASISSSGTRPQPKTPPKISPKDAIIDLRFVGRQGIELDGHWAIRSAIGTGKTELIIEQMNRHKRVLVIGHRVSLIDQMTARFNAAGLGFEHYRQVPREQLSLVDRLVITPNSLYKIMDNRDKPPQYDMIVIDESESVLEHVLGDTFQKRQGLFAHALMIELVRNTENVIFADANLSKVSVNWLRRHGQRKAKIFNNQYKMERGKMVIFDDRTATLDALETTLLRAKKPVAVATDSKAEALKLDRYLKFSGFNGVCISSNNSQNLDIQAFLADINNRLAEYQYLIYTPSMGVGVDIQAEVHSVFGFFSNRSITAYDQFQALGRCRKADTFIIYSAEIKSFAETDPAKIMRNILDNVTEHAIDYGLSFNFESGRVKPTRTQLDYLRLYADIEAHRNRLMNRARDEFIKLATKEYKVKVVENIGQGASKDAYDDIKKLEAKYWRELTLNSTPITPEDYDEWRGAGKLSDEIIAGFDRWQIEEYFKRDIAEDLLEFAAEDGIAKTQNFIMLHRPASEILTLDKRDHEEDLPLHKRRLRTQETRLARKLLKVIFPQGFHFIELAHNELEQLLEQFQQIWQDENADRIFNRRSHHSKEGLARLRWLLGKQGLKLHTIYRTREKHKLYQLCFASYQTMCSYANVRLMNIGKSDKMIYPVLNSDIAPPKCFCQNSEHNEIAREFAKSEGTYPDYFDEFGYFWATA